MLETLFLYLGTERLISTFWFEFSILPIILFVLILELVLVGFKDSSFKRVAYPKRTDWWDILSLLFNFTGFRLLLANVILFGAVSWWASNERHSLEFLSSSPFWIQLGLALLLNDFVSYWAHRLKHESRWLWSTHEFHHSSTHLTMWVSNRVHALDSLMIIPSAAIVQYVFAWEITGLIFFVYLNEFFGYLSHSRIDWDGGWLGRNVFVTPRFHHLHHDLEKDMKFNYGRILVVWDRIFGTYKAPAVPISKIQPGISNNRFEERSMVVAYLAPVVDFYLYPVRQIKRVCMKCFFLKGRKTQA